VFRHFLMEGVEAYKNYCFDEDEIGQDVLSFNSEAVAATIAASTTSTSSSSQPSGVKVYSKRM